MATNEQEIIVARIADAYNVRNAAESLRNRLGALASELRQVAKEPAMSDDLILTLQSAAEQVEGECESLFRDMSSMTYEINELVGALKSS